MPTQRPLTLALAVLVFAGSAFAAAAPAIAAGYSTGGAIGALYKAQGGSLGSPTSNEFTGYKDRVQNFRYGIIYWTRATGAHSVRGGILGEYRRYRTDAGKLGLPLTEEKKTTGGVYQQFKGGIIYWAPKSGAHATLGGIRSVYAQTGAERGALGFPTSSETTARNAGATFVYQTFERGIITWNNTYVPVYNEDPGRAHVVFPEFYKEYVAAGGTKTVGYVSTNIVTGQPDGVSGSTTIAVQWFQNGGIFSKTGAGVHYLPNAWLEALSDDDAAVLGFPTSGVHDVDGGTQVTFEHGSVALSPDGTFTVELAPAAAASVRSVPVPLPKRTH